MFKLKTPRIAELGERNEKRPKYIYNLYCNLNTKSKILGKSVSAAS